VREVISRLSPKGWAIVGGSAAATVLFLVLVMHFASTPSYSTLLTGLDPAQTGKITSTLDTKGIPYQIQNNGTALAVASGETAKARIALATAGLLGSSSDHPGFELFNSQSLGQSQFQQQITYQRALEGQLDQTIDQIQGVNSAQVNLVLPDSQNELFADTAQNASASVLLDSSPLDSGSVKGIAQLVASSVPSLDLDKVTITDQAGELLWPTSGQSASSNGLLSKQSTERAYDATMAAQVTSVLDRTLGQGKAEVQVNADLNANQATSNSLTYANKGVPLTQQTSTETLTGTGANGGKAGTAGNIPGYAATNSGNSNYRNTTSNTTYGVDKTVTDTTVAPGAINSQSMSVLVDKSVPASEIPSIRSAVAAAVGLNANRGDTLSIAQIAFAKPATTSGTGGMSTYLSYAKYVLVGLAAAVFLFFISRLLRRREQEDFAGHPTWLHELTSPRPLASLEGADSEATELTGLHPPLNITRRQIEELVERDPDRVAQQVRAWIAED